MKSRISTCFAVALATTALLLGSAAPTEACPFCGGPTLTLSEQFLRAHAVLLVRWIDGRLSDEAAGGRTTCEVVRVIRDTQPGESLPPRSKVLGETITPPETRQKPFTKGQIIPLAESSPGKTGDLNLLIGSLLSKPSGQSMQWKPLEITATSFAYVMQAPSRDLPAPQRLEYFLKFLEDPDQTIANDAYAEFANASYADIVALAPSMPRDKLRNWLFGNKVPQNRLGLYGMMLGLCGDQADALRMEQKINESPEKLDEPRPGIDGIIGGYLLLTGDRGLAFIDRSKLSDKNVPSMEILAAVQALRFMWEYADNKVPKERLRLSMRLLLDRPDLADIAITDLSRWKDWSIQKRLMRDYGASDSFTKRAIIRYMVASTKDNTAGSDGRRAQHVVAGAQYLEMLRKEDPKTVANAERFFR